LGANLSFLDFFQNILVLKGLMGQRIIKSYSDQGNIVHLKKQYNSVFSIAFELRGADSQFFSFSEKNV
jgi:hypothetical protein